MTRRTLLIEFYRDKSAMYYRAATELRDWRWLWGRKWRYEQIAFYQGWADVYAYTARLLAGIE